VYNQSLVACNSTMVNCVIVDNFNDFTNDFDNFGRGGSDFVIPPSVHLFL
jgi:hypothetical protein